ncbi:MAG: hypothetical protein ACJ788_18255 [Ktedonobacteraceae bacterium]
MQSEIEGLIDTLNMELMAGHWQGVVEHAAALHAHALAVGEGQLAELARDIQVIAEDAVHYPAGDDGRLEVAELVL